MEFELGQTYSGYKFLDVVGRSRSAVQYRVQNTLAQRVEGLRTLTSAAGDDPDAVERFLREVRIRARLSHPHIITFYTAVPIEGRMAMTTELPDSLSLAERLHLGPLPWEEAIDITRQLLEALACIHQQSFVHRDITPENILFGPGGFCKLAEFSLARPLEPAHATESGTVVGNPRYISPEQVKGERSLDQRSDLYSLGVVLYEMLCGRPPFESRSQFELMMAHVNLAPAPPSSIRANLPGFLDAVVLKALAKDAEDRYPSASAFADALGGPNAEIAGVEGATPTIAIAADVPELVAVPVTVRAAEAVAVMLEEVEAEPVVVAAEPAIAEVVPEVVGVVTEEAEPVVEPVVVAAEPAIAEAVPEVVGVVTEEAEPVAEPVVVAAEPAIAEVVPEVVAVATEEAEPVAEPVVVAAEPAIAEVVPEVVGVVTEEAEPVAEPVVVAVEPAITEVVPEVVAVVTEEAEPVAEPVMVAAEPAIAEVVPEVVAVMAEDAETVAEPVMVAAEPAIAEVVPEVVAVMTEVAEAEPVAEPVVVAVEPAIAEVVPEVVAVVAEDAKPVAEPVVVAAEPAIAEVVPEVVAVVTEEVEPVAEPVVVAAEPAIAEVVPEVVAVVTEEAEPVTEPVVVAAGPAIAEVVPEFVAVVTEEAEPVAEPVVVVAGPAILEVVPEAVAVMVAEAAAEQGLVAAPASEQIAEATKETAPVIVAELAVSSEPVNAEVAALGAGEEIGRQAKAPAPQEGRAVPDAVAALASAWITEVAVVAPSASMLSEDARLELASTEPASWAKVGPTPAIPAGVPAEDLAVTVAAPPDPIHNNLWAAAEMVAEAVSPHAAPPVSVTPAPLPLIAAPPPPAPAPTPMPQAVPEAMPPFMTRLRRAPDHLQWAVFGGAAAFLGVIWVAIWLAVGK